MALRSSTSKRLRWARQKGVALLEVSMAMGLAVVLALVVMRASLLALSGNQWTIMQTLTDAFLTRETALMVRLPLADMTDPAKPAYFWPEYPAFKRYGDETAVEIGSVSGGRKVTATLIRFREDETPAAGAGTGLTVWRLHSVLEYQVGGQQYVKSRSTVRME